MTSTPGPFQRLSAKPAVAQSGILALPLARALPIVLLAMAVQAGILYAFGMTPICKCGTVKLWHGLVDAENSQHLTDWYTFSHVVHGFLFYWLAWLAFPRASLWFRLVLAVIVEVGWEVVENTPMVIERYRAGTISLNYFGDSIVNSLGDTLATIVGFFVAAVLPASATLGLAIAMEVALAAIIRDNLVLNVLMLLFPVEAVLKWQSGA